MQDVYTLERSSLASAIEAENLGRLVGVAGNGLPYAALLVDVLAPVVIGKIVVGQPLPAR